MDNDIHIVRSGTVFCVWRLQVASTTRGSRRAAPGAGVTYVRFCAFPKGTPIVRIPTLGARHYIFGFLCLLDS